MQDRLSAHVQEGRTRDLSRHFTSFYQHCGRGQIAAIINFDDTIFHAL